MEFYEHALRVIVSLAVVVVIALLGLPYIARRFMGLKGMGSGDSFEVKKVLPLSKNVSLVELKVKGKTLLLVVGERGADVIYREDEGEGTRGSEPASGSHRSGESDTSHRAQDR